MALLRWQTIRWVLALMPWAGIVLGVWWALEPLPMKPLYVAPRFTSVPVVSKAEAEQYAIDEAVGGTVVYRFSEGCIDRRFTGTMRRAWVNAALVWHAPDLPTVLSEQERCFAASMAIEVPTSSPSRSFTYVHELVIDLNPLRDGVIKYPPIPLRILSPEDAVKRGK